MLLLSGLHAMLLLLLLPPPLPPPSLLWHYCRNLTCLYYCHCFASQLVGVRTLEQTLAYLQYFAASEARFRAARMANVYTLQVGRWGWLTGGATGCGVAIQGGMRGGWTLVYIRTTMVHYSACWACLLCKKRVHFSCLPPSTHMLAIHATHAGAPLSPLLCHPAPQLDGSGFPNTDWCSNHPDEETHTMIADQLAAFVRRVAPGWAY